MMLIETVYRNFSIVVGQSIDTPGTWSASIAHSGRFIGQVEGRSEAAALAEAKARVDLLTEKPR